MKISLALFYSKFISHLIARMIPAFTNFFFSNFQLFNTPQQILNGIVRAIVQVYEAQVDHPNSRRSFTENE